MRASAEPRYFGPSERPLFGWLHRPPSGVAARSTGVVICNPFGHEALCAHRSLRHFADGAAGWGYPSLRFDYDGTGDSAGGELDPGRPAAWQQSVHAAIDELRRSTGVTRVCLLGVRFGATIAALAAVGRQDLAGLAVIAPIVTGRLWLRELRALRAAMGRPDPPPEFALPEGVTESVGLPLDADTREWIAGVDLVAIPDLPASDCLVLDRDDRPANEAWCARLAALGARVDHRIVPGLVPMMLDPHEAQVPEAMIAAFGQWLGSRFPGPAEGRPVPVAATQLGPVRVEAAVEESAHFLDPAGTLFGLTSAPVGDRPTRVLVLLNSGSNHHIGGGRMYVKVARRLAARGWLVIRYDVSGIGDSAPHDGCPENEVYTSRAVGDLATALEFARARFGVEDAEIAGLCSGAYHAFKGAVAGLPIRGLTVVNPLVFFWKEGMSLAYPPFEMVQAATHYQESIFRPAKWLRLVRGQVDVPMIVRVVASRAADRGRGLITNLRRSLGFATADDLGAEVERIAAAGTRLRFLFSFGDPGEALLEAGVGWTLWRLQRRGSLQIGRLPNCDHSLSGGWMHEVLWRELLAELEGR